MFQGSETLVAGRWYLQRTHNCYCSLRSHRWPVCLGRQAAKGKTYKGKVPANLRHRQCVTALRGRKTWEAEPNTLEHAKLQMLGRRPLLIAHRTGHYLALPGRLAAVAIQAATTVSVTVLCNPAGGLHIKGKNF